ncbi:hypothetical protein [Ectobacillus ponti]|uniref:Uncharacterized protein n=1 Tax=Ectobacillus ponti TaxID=2961894 RepID=A0AA42BPG0_9BACI|nr:hypothetical protein [Ectobacillus ponti]MCP8969085.1 hypothetical protein [Ectobacillus ponti]
MGNHMAAEQLRSLTEQFIVFTSQSRPQCSEEELLFSLNCLLRALHAALPNVTDERDISYMETRLHTAYNLITGHTVFPF